MAKSKVYSSPKDALVGLQDKASLLISGSGGESIPSRLVRAVKDAGVKDLTLVYSGGVSGWYGGYEGIDDLVESGMVSRIISPMPFVPGEQSVVKKAVESGTVDLDIQPLGILSERLRAAGAGLGGVFLPTGVGTRFQQDKEKRLIDGREYILQQPLSADFAFIKARKSDTLGNLIYRGSSRNWGPVMAMAAAVCIAEVEEICEPGELDPEYIITQGIFVNRIVRTK